MKLSVIALAMAATAFGSMAAYAQTTTIIQEERPAAVVIEPAPSAEVTTTTRERTGILGTTSKTTTETTGSGAFGECSSKTVHKEGLAGEKTVSKTNCP